MKWDSPSTVTRVKQGRKIGTKHTFIASAATKVFAIAKLAFANVSRATKDLAAVAPLVRKTAMGTGSAARFLKVVEQTQLDTRRGTARKRSCVYVIPGGVDQRAA